MTIICLRRSYADYSKVDKEDPEEVSRRRAQFLIYKVLQKADYFDSNNYCGSRKLRIRLYICKLKIKIGKRLKRLRKGILVSISAARIAFYKQLICHLKTWKRLFGVNGGHPERQTISPINNNSNINVINAALPPSTSIDDQLIH